MKFSILILISVLAVLALPLVNSGQTVRHETTVSIVPISSAGLILLILFTFIISMAVWVIRTEEASNKK